MSPRLLLFLFIMTTVSGSARELLVYIGTYTKTASKGIYAGRFDPATGRLGPLSLAAPATDPSFLALAPDGRHLYAVSESANELHAGLPGGTVGSFAIDADTGLLTAVNHAASGGRSPCQLSVAPDGKHVFVANYNGGTVAMLPVLAGGGLGEPSCVIRHEGHGPHPTRQKQPHAHSIGVSPDGRFAYAADLGTDKVYTYRIDSAAGTLVPVAETAIAPGSGPRHLAFHPDDRHAYLVNELSSTVTVFARDPSAGTLTTLQTVTTLPAGFTGHSTAAEIAVHPGGRFVYASNRGHDSIAVFRVDPTAGTLTPVEDVSTQGKNPRHFALAPDGRWLIAANQDGNTLVIFAVDPATGRLTPTGQSVPLGAPVCVRFF